MEANVEFKIVSTDEFVAVASKIWPEKPLAAVCRDVAKNFYLSRPLGKGLYKLRLPVAGKGKKGGARVIFLCITQQREILLLTAYAKARIENLTKAQLDTLAKLGKTVLDEGDWKDGQGNFRVFVERIEAGGKLQERPANSARIPDSD